MITSVDNLTSTTDSFTYTSQKCLYCDQELSQETTEYSSGCLECNKKAHKRCIKDGGISNLNGNWRCPNCLTKPKFASIKCLICKSSGQPMVQIGIVQADPLKQLKSDFDKQNGGQIGPSIQAHEDCVKSHNSIFKNQQTNQYEVHFASLQQLSEFEKTYMNQCSERGHIQTNYAFCGQYNESCGHCKINLETTIQQSQNKVKDIPILQQICGSCQGLSQQVRGFQNNQGQAKIQQNSYQEEQVQSDCKEELQEYEQRVFEQNIVNSNDQILPTLGKRTQREHSVVPQDQSSSLITSPQADTDPSVSSKRQRKSEERSQQSKSKSIDASGDPFTFLLKEALSPIIYQIDKLQVLKKDKIKYQISLLLKDLKQLSRERKDELLNQRVYLDKVQDYQSCLMTLNLGAIDQQKEQEILNQTSEEILPTEEIQVTLNETGLANEESMSPDSKGLDMKMEIDEGSEEFSKMSNGERESSSVNQSNEVDQEFQKPQKKKRRKAPLTMNGRKPKSSQNLQSLPSNLSDFSWIENTDLNIKYLEEERIKQQELKKKKELEKLAQQANEEQKDQIIEQVDQILNVQTKEPVWEYKSNQELESLDDIYERIDYGYYHSIDAIITDLDIIAKKAIANRCLNALSQSYVTNVLIKAVALIKSKEQQFKAKWRQTYEYKFTQNELYFPKVRSGWWKSPGAKREYNTLDNYKIATPDANSNANGNNHQKQMQESIVKKMKTTKSSQCNGQCCLKIDDLGPFKLNNDLWETQCQCRIKKVECSDQCGCDPNSCKNRQMSLHQALKLGKDVVEKNSWGVDICTAVNLMILLPKDVPQKIQSDFVENRLVFAVQQQGPNGYDVRYALRYILTEIENKRFRPMDRQFAQIVLDGIKNCKGQNENHFRIHSKGIGIFCQKEEGIQANNLIIEYFGEIYQPWYWYEKQDVLKQGQNKASLSKELPDFYNITYERHQDDPQGYDILMVDPILYGNYSSRLSHSCNPNCSTIIHVRKGEYSIGMYAIKDVKFGEELCFNYCSFTESEKEYESAVCLCGTEICQGRFLQLANDKKHLAIMKQYHTFVDRNYILWKACKYPQLTEEEEQRLQTFGLKESVMNNVPDWLRKWATLICDYILFEEQMYPSVLKQDFPHLSEDDLKIDAKGLRDGKLWNVAITIDKVMHVLDSMGIQEAPIKDLSFKEKYKKLWEGDGSIRNSLFYILGLLDDSDVKQECLDLISQNHKVVIINNFREEDRYFEQLFNQIRDILAQISDKLRVVKSNKIMITGLCDILWLYANTETYFTPNENYKKFTGEEIKVRKCDVRMCESTQVGSLNPVELERTVYKGKKEYDPGYIWGQLVGWFKQTVDKPNASLSADRRGTLSMPDLESFIVTQKNQEDLKNTVKRKKKKRDDDFEEEEPLTKKSGTRSRPVTKSKELMNQQDTSLDAMDIQTEESKNTCKEPRTKYPHKKHQKRQEFLENWNHNFSKQWDVCCQWSFKNKQRLYGSVQFESVLKADNDRQRRLDFFNTVVNHLVRQ